MLAPSHPPRVNFGLDPRALHFTTAPQVQSPRVKPEGDDRGWGNTLSRSVAVRKEQHYV